MKKILALLAFVCLAPAPGESQTIYQNSDVPVVYNNLESLEKFRTDATVAVVKDPLRGGIFIKSTAKRQPDNGVVFASPDGGCWVRSFNEQEGVNPAWFGAKMDSTTNDADALKRAMRYNIVTINAPMKVAGKIGLSEDHTIVFGNKGYLIIADSCTVNFNAYLKTEDYAYIFRGKGSVLFGTKATPYVSPCWFGAVADFKGHDPQKATDNQPAIEKAIIAAENVSDIYLPPSAANTSYRIASCITIAKKLHFFSLKFHGGGTTVTTSQVDKATTIFADFVSGPAINIQGSRRSYISDIRIRGRNAAPKTVLAARWDAAIYATPSYDTITYFYDENIHKDYAGIATDAEKNNNVLSADIQFDRLQIEGFYVGLSINAAGRLQGDRMRVSNCQINYCTYGISIGNPQARACHFENVDMDYVYIGYTNSTFGNGSGSEFQITGGQYCNLYKLFHIQPYNLGQCVVTGLYTEGLGSIGEIGYNGPHDNSFIFNGCSFLLLDVTGYRKKYGYYSKYYTLTANANVTFEGCNFWSLKYYLAMKAGNMDSSFHPLINLNGCTFNRTNFFHGWGNVNIENCHFTPNAEAIDMNRTIRARMDGARRYNTGFYATTVIPLFDGMNDADTTNTSSAKQIARTIPKFYAVADCKDAISDTSVRADTITFRYNDNLEQKIFRYVKPGDILGTPLKGMGTDWDNPTLHVNSIDHNTKTISATMLSETLSLDKFALYTNCFFTTQPVTGDVKEGSNTITNTKNESLLAEGDYISFKEAPKPYRINKVDTTNHTIELMDAIKEKEHNNVALYNLQLYSIPQ